MSGNWNSYTSAPATGQGYGYQTGGQAKRPKTGGNSGGAPSYASSYDASGGNTGSYGSSGYSSYGAAAATTTTTGYQGYNYNAADYTQDYTGDYSSYYTQPYSSNTAAAQGFHPPLPKTNPPLPKGEPPKAKPLMSDPWGVGAKQPGGFDNGSARGARGGPRGGRGGPRGFSRGGPRGGGRGTGGNSGVIIGPQRSVPKPKTPSLTNDQKARVENHNVKQLVCPKPPNKVLNEMMGGPVAYEYTENPPLPPDCETFDEMHTLVVHIDGETSTGTGPSHDIAKNICAEHAVMGVCTRRYQAINEMVNKGIKSKDELLLEDETPFELASMAIYKLLNEWEAKGFELPPDLEDILYTSHMYLPVKERLSWIRGSNLGYFTPLEAPPGLPARSRGRRSKTMRNFDDAELGHKNPVAFLNEIRGTVDYMELGGYGDSQNMTYSIGVNIDGTPYSGTGPSKKDAKKACAADVLTRLYGINVTSLN